MPEAGIIDSRSIINDSGQILVLSDSAFGAANYLVLESDGTVIRNVVLNGDSLPGGGTFNSTDDDNFELNNSGQVLFEATSIQNGGSSTGVFFDNGTDIISIARFNDIPTFVQPAGGGSGVFGWSVLF